MLSTPASHSMAGESTAVVPVAMPALRTALYTSFCAELRYAYKLYISSAPEEKNFDEVAGIFDVSTATDGSKWVNSTLPSHISPCFGALRAKAPTEAQEISIRNAKNTETVFFIFNTLCNNDFFLFFIQEAGKLLHKCVHIFKMLIYRRKAHICDLVNLFQLFHYKLAHTNGGYFTVKGILKR